MKFGVCWNTLADDAYFGADGVLENAIILNTHPWPRRRFGGASACLQ